MTTRNPNNRFQMATFRVPQLTVETPSSSGVGSTSAQSSIGNCHFQVLFGCNADGDVVSLEPSGATDDTNMCEDDCSPIEEEVESQEVPACEASPPSPKPEHRTFASKDLPLPQYASRLCLSPPPMTSRTVSVDGEHAGSISPASSETTASSQDEEVIQKGTPCNCPLVEARRMTEAAKRAALVHYKAHAQTYTFPDGRQVPMVRQWMQETIRRNMDLGYGLAVGEMKRIAEIANPGGWPVHSGGKPCQGYLGRVQPWMRALMHRVLVEAANAAFADIDKREGTVSKERPAFQFSVPGIINPTAMRFPCLCKETHAISIATKVLEQSMTKLAPLISTLATCMPGKDRVAIHSRVWQRMYGQIQLAICKAFRDIMEDSDVAQRCAGHEMAHVQPYMTKAIEHHCELAARLERKTLQWKARDIQIHRFQKWLEQLYLDEEDDEQMGESAQEEQCSAGINEVGDCNNSHNNK